MRSTQRTLAVYAKSSSSSSQSACSVGYIIVMLMPNATMHVYSRETTRQRRRQMQRKSPRRRHHPPPPPLLPPLLQMMMSMSRFNTAPRHAGCQINIWRRQAAAAAAARRRIPPAPVRHGPARHRGTSSPVLHRVRPSASRIDFTLMRSSTPRPLLMHNIRRRRAAWQFNADEIPLAARPSRRAISNTS